MVLKPAIMVVIVSILSGCAQLAPVTDRAAKANDSAVQSAEFMLCNGASVGAIRRAYGTNDRSRIWRDLCRQENGFTPEAGNDE